MAHQHKKNRSHKSRSKKAESAKVAAPAYIAGKAQHSWLILLGILVAGGALYGFTLNYPFHFDGESYMLRNPLLKDGGSFLSLFDFAKIRRLVSEAQLSSDIGVNFILRPVTYLTFYLNAQVFGWTPAAFRVVNILIHCLNTFLVFKLVAHLLQFSPKSGTLRPSSHLFVPLAAAALFMAHPLQTESVTYLVQRFTSLGTLFYLLTLLLYFQSKAAGDSRKARLLQIGSVVALLAGTFSKEEVFTAPVLLVLLDRFVMDAPWKASLRRAWPQIVCMLLMPALVMALAVTDHRTGSVMDRALGVACDPPLVGYNWAYALTQIRVVVLYLGLLLVPGKQNVDWDIMGSNSLRDGQVLSSAAVIGVLLVGAWFIYRRCCMETRHALLFVAVLWYFITVLISSSIIPLPDLMAEHRTYLPSIGVMLALVCGVDLLRTQFFQNRLIARALPFAVAVWVFGLGAATVERNEVWRTGVSLWADASLKSPEKFRVWGNLGVSYGAEGRFEEGRKCLVKALQLKSDYLLGYRNLSIILSNLSKNEEALQVARTGLRICGDDVWLNYDMAVAYCAIGRVGDGIQSIEKALAKCPTHYLSRLSLGDIYAALAKYDAAMEQYKIAAKLSTDHAVAQRIADVEAKAHPLAGANIKAGAMP